jgi:hypothetical protein
MISQIVIEIVIGWASLRAPTNLGAGPFDLEGSGFRVNFRRNRHVHATLAFVKGWGVLSLSLFSPLHTLLRKLFNPQALFLT